MVVDVSNVRCDGSRKSVAQKCFALVCQLKRSLGVQRHLMICKKCNRDDMKGGGGLIGQCNIRL